MIDWDGTATERDTLHMAIERFGDLAVFERLEARLDRLTLDEVIAAEMATITAPLEVVVGWLLEHVRMRRGFHELVEASDPLIVSAGFHELIEPILEREGVAVRLVANHVVANPAGWRSSFRDGPACEVCGQRCKRGDFDFDRYAYAGDGVSDRCAALGAERRFARDGLADWLDARGVAYERFGDLYDVLEKLAEGGGAVVPPTRSRGLKT